MEEIKQRTTANVVTDATFGKAYGVVVDTHVKRSSQKFELTKNTDPVKIEKDLMELLPKDKWIKFPHQLILYGREYCPARPHDCKDHPLTKLYPPVAKIWSAR